MSYWKDRPVVAWWWCDGRNPNGPRDEVRANPMTTTLDAKEAGTVGPHLGMVANQA
jgi:hypothetical protein